MSVQVNTYVVLGVRLPYKKGEDQFDKWEKLMDSAYEPALIGELVCLFDGMCGNYIIVGRVLAVTGCHEAFEDPIEIGMKMLDPREHEYDEVRRELVALGVEPPLSLFVVDHHR